MTFDSESPNEHVGGRGWIIACIALIGVTIAALMIAYLAVNVPPISAEPRIDSSFEDRNQTRAELVNIINRQRAAVYSSYVLEYAFCDSRMDEVKTSFRSDVNVTGQITKLQIHCTDSDNQTQTYTVEYDAGTNKYKETLKFQLPTSHASNFGSVGHNS